MALCAIFEEDEISIETEKGLKYGLVLESAEYLSSDEEEDDAFWDSVKKGTVRVAWHPDGTEEVVPEKEITLADRSLMPGDVVRRLIEGQDSQRGYVRFTNVGCNVQIIGKNKVICGVDSRDLAFLDYWDGEQGDVYLDSWVGKVEKVTESVVLRLPDGASVEASSDDFYTELSSFEDIHEKRERDTEFCVNSYYPGQRLKGYFGELEKAYWHVTTKNYSPEQAKKKAEKEVICTVIKVETEKIDVNWLCQGYSKVSGEKASPPPRTLNKDDVKRLQKMDCFESCSVQIGDHAFYVLKERDVIHNVSQSSSKTLINYVIKNKLYNRSKSVDNETDVLNARNATNNAESMLQLDTISGQNKVDSGEQFGENCNYSDTCITTADSIMGKSSTVPKTIERTLEKGKISEDGVGICISKEERDRENIAETNGESGNSMNGNPTDSNAGEVFDVDGDDEYDDVSDAESTGSASSALSSSSNPGKKKKAQYRRGGSVQTKLLKKKKLKKSKKKEDVAMWEFKPGDNIPVEVISTCSYVEVMWQDGTIESDIKSTELYPIHHLDDQEFFPGDFVLPADGGDSHEYGVVQSVDHAGRTCVLKWIKPYVIGSAVNQPMERLESEEVSVYDLKDHSDYKFRPGVHVIRVGGYEEKSLVAAGQVFELGLDGRLLIHWADQSRSHVYPQELYLIGDDLSELSEFDDDSESSASESESNKSWETESEEELSCDDDETVEEDDGQDNKPQRVLRMDENTEKCFETVIESLQKLEDLFALSDIDFCQSACFAEVVNLYKTCKKIDTKLNSSYFDDAKLRKYMSAIRDDMKKDKTAQFAKRIQELIEQNRAAENSTKPRDQEESTTKPRNQEESTTKPRDQEERTTEARDQEKKSTKPCEFDEKTAEPCDHKENKEGGKDGGNLSDSTPDTSVDLPLTSHTEAAAAQVSQSATATAVVRKSDQGTQTVLQTDCGKCNTHTRELCQKAVHLLREIIITIREEMAQIVSSKDKLAEEEERLKEELTELEQAEAGAIPSSGDDARPDVAMAVQETDAEGLPTEHGSAVADAVSQHEGTPCVHSGGDSAGEGEAEQADEGGDDTGKKDKKEKLELCITPGEGVTENSLSPVTPQTPADVRSKIVYNLKGFVIAENAPQSHKFIRIDSQATDPKFMTAVRKDHKILHSSLPLDIFVKSFEDRMDLFSVMIHGPKHTPYEDGLFFFDVKLPKDYPTAPPRLHYIAYCTERLNPNLYEDGKVCVSLLGTWTGKGTEVWNSQSTLLQVLISIQGLILVSEPYYNEAGYERQKGTQQGLENSRMYNEMTLIKMIQSMTKMAKYPPEIFTSEVQEHIALHGPRMIERFQYWLENAVPASGATITIQDTSPKATEDQSKPSPAAQSVNQSDGDKDDQAPPTANLFGLSGGVRSEQPPAVAMETRSVVTISDNEELGNMDAAAVDCGSTVTMPEFPLLPVSKGFVLTLRKLLTNFRKAINS